MNSRIVFKNSFAILAAVMCLLASWQTSQASLLLRYTFDEGPGNGTANDQVSPAANGTFLGTATRATSFLSAGYAFDVSTATGAGNYLSCGNPAKLNSSSTLSNGITITCWVNLAVNSGTADRLVDKCSTTGGFDFFVASNAPTTVQLGLFINSTTANVGKSSSITNLNQQWAFCAVTYDGTASVNNAKFYVGGTNGAVSLLSTASVNQGKIKDTPNELRIAGTAATTADRTPPALIDSVRIYDSVLTAADLEAIRLADGGAADPNTLPPSITAQPGNTSGYVGATVSFSASVSGSVPIAQQWYLNGTNAGNAISSQTNLTLTLTNITAGMNGNVYTMLATNNYGVAWTTNAVLTVTTPFNTSVLTNIWTLANGDRSYLIPASGNSPTDRGLTFNPATSNLLFTSRGDSGLGTIVVALDPATGAQKYLMTMTGISGGTFNLNLVRAAADGVVYGCNLTTSAGTTSYKLYQWGNDDSNTVPVLSFAGDPGFGVASGLRWGDSMAVRGAGLNTQILLGPGTGTNVALFTTSDGVNFLPTIIAVSGVVDHFAQNGLAFGPGTNTFWAKNSESANLYLVQFDANTQTGTVLQSYTNLPTIYRGIAVDSTQHWLIGAATENPDTMRLYDISNLTNGPLLADQELFAIRNLVAGQPTDAVFGGDKAFVLDPANGIKAFQFNTALSPFNITSVSVASGSVVLTWQSVAGHSYQVQSRSALNSGSWADLGSPVSASGTTTSATNALSGDVQFYRVVGQ